MADVKNTSSVNPPGWDSLPLYVLYLTEGIVIGSANLIIVVCILRYEALRTSKVHLVMLSLAFADACNMLGAYTGSGLYRIYTVFTGSHDNLVSPWYCATLPHVFVEFVVGPHGSALQLLVMSMDRLMATSRPLDYLCWPRMYTLIMLGASHGWVLFVGLVGVCLAYTKRDEFTIKARCSFTRTYIAAARGTPYALYYSVAAPLFALLSVIVYVVVGYKYKTSVRQETNSDVEQQRTVTRTLGYSCLCTLFLYVVPISLAVLARWFELSFWGTFLFTLTNLNGLMNLFIYQFRQPEMRLALVGLFTWKQMPIDLRQWRANNNANNTNVGFQKREGRRAQATTHQEDQEIEEIL